MDQKNTSGQGGSQSSGQNVLPVSSDGTILAWSDLSRELQQTYGSEFQYQETVKSLGGTIGERFIPHNVSNR